jgi:hypothetical protein
LGPGSSIDEYGPRMLWIDALDVGCGSAGS